MASLATVEKRKIFMHTAVIYKLCKMFCSNTIVYLKSYTGCWVYLIPSCNTSVLAFSGIPKSNLRCYLSSIKFFIHVLVMIRFVCKLHAVTLLNFTINQKEEIKCVRPHVRRIQENNMKRSPDKMESSELVLVWMEINVSSWRRTYFLTL